MCVVSWIRHLMTGPALEGSPARRPALRSARSNVNSRSLPALTNITAQPHAPAQVPRPDPRRAPAHNSSPQLAKAGACAEPAGLLEARAIIGTSAQGRTGRGLELGAWGSGLGALQLQGSGPPKTTRQLISGTRIEE